MSSEGDRNGAGPVSWDCLVYEGACWALFSRAVEREVPRTGQDLGSHCVFC